MESVNSAAWPKINTLIQRVDSLALATVAEMRSIPFIPFPHDGYPKAVEFVMIVRNEFTKRLKSELETLPSDTEPFFVRAQVYKVLRVMRNEIAFMADNGTGWLEKQLEHTLKNTVTPKSVFCWADRYLDAMLISIGG